MVLDRDVEYFPGLYELFSYYPVVGRWCRVPARMIVNQYDCRRPLRDRLSEDFPRMHQRRVQEPARYRNVALEPMLRIEHGDVKFFDGQIFQALREIRAQSQNANALTQVDTH